MAERPRGWRVGRFLRRQSMLGTLLAGNHRVSSPRPPFDSRQTIPPLFDKPTWNPALAIALVGARPLALLRRLLHRRRADLCGRRIVPHMPAFQTLRPPSHYRETAWFDAMAAANPGNTVPKRRRSRPSEPPAVVSRPGMRAPRTVSRVQFQA